MPPSGENRPSAQGERPMSASPASVVPTRFSDSKRWIQLILGIICMASVANLQYGWTLFVLPIQQKFGWTKAEIQVAFTIFILLETWLVPFEGAIVDRIGPRWMVLAGGIGTFLAWFINSRADSLAMLYLGGAVAGFAAGAVYGTCVGNALNGFRTSADCVPGSPPRGLALAPRSRSRRSAR